MSRARESDIAEIGYKIQVNDYIAMTTPFNMVKYYKVTAVTGDTVIVQFEGKYGVLRFNRHYHLPFKPLTKENNADYESPNEWSVRVNDINLKRKKLL